MTPSAPPVPAANPARVERSRFTHGSRWEYIAALVTASTRIERDSGASPHASATRDQQRRAAPELRGTGELVCVDGEHQGELAGSVGQRHARRLAGPQVGDRGGEDEAQLLGVRSAGLGVDRPVGDQRAHLGEAGRAVLGQGGRRGEVGRSTVAGLGAEWVGAETARGLRPGHAALAPQRLQPARDLGKARAGVEPDRCRFEVDAAEHRVEIGLAGHR